MFNTLDHRESKTNSRPISEVHSHHKSKKHKHGSKKHGHGHGHGHKNKNRRYTVGLGTLNNSFDPGSRNMPSRRINVHNTA